MPRPWQHNAATRRELSKDCVMNHAAIIPEICDPPPTSYAFEASTHYMGRARTIECSVGEYVYTARADLDHDPLPALAARLVADGWPDRPWREVPQLGHKVRRKGRSLRELAALAPSEPPTTNNKAT